LLLGDLVQQPADPLHVAQVGVSRARLLSGHPSRVSES
jgi:hypothetical protein